MKFDISDWFYALAVMLMLGLVSIDMSGCSGAQMQIVQSDIASGIQAACQDVNAAAAINPTSPVALYAQAACPLGTAAANLVQNSATLQWLGQIQAQLAPAKS